MRSARISRICSTPDGAEFGYAAPDAWALGLQARIRLAAGEVEKALASASAALELFGRSGRAEDGEFVARLANAEALNAAGQSDAARRSLADTYTRLCVRADGLKDDALRTMLLERLPENARIVELARQWLDGAGRV